MRKMGCFASIPCEKCTLQGACHRGKSPEEWNVREALKHIPDWYVVQILLDQKFDSADIQRVACFHKVLLTYHVSNCEGRGCGTCRDWGCYTMIYAPESLYPRKEFG